MRLKGDTLQFDMTYPQDITNWKIRAELFDKSGNTIKKATSNSGGSDDEIEKTTISATSSTFRIKIPSNQTTSFDDIVSLEFEIDTGETVGGSPKLVSEIIEGINLKEEQIDWTDPNA